MCVVPDANLPALPIDDKHDSKLMPTTLMSI